MSPQVCHGADTTGPLWAHMRLCTQAHHPAGDPVSNSDMRLIHILLNTPCQSGFFIGSCNAGRPGRLDSLPLGLQSWIESDRLFAGSRLLFGNPFRVPRPQHNSLSSRAIDRVPENHYSVFATIGRPIRARTKPQAGLYPLRIRLRCVVCLSLRFSFLHAQPPVLLSVPHFPSSGSVFARVYSRTSVLMWLGCTCQILEQ